jgi:hypothetical protein
MPPNQFTHRKADHAKTAQTRALNKENTCSTDRELTERE